ncbi:hypothetical protein BH10CYA1_BH10CYA1_36660 [soil metagenome]
MSPQCQAQSQHKDPKHVNHKQQIVSSNRAAVEAAKKAAAEAAKTSKTADETAEQAFLSARESWAKMFMHLKAAPDNERGAKLIEALRPVAMKYFKMPLKLVSQTQSGGGTTLVFKATDPSIDFRWICTATKVGSEWLITNQDFKGKNSVDVAIDPFKAISSVFPNEISTITLACTIFIGAWLATLIASIFLVVEAFKVSVLWGLVAFFVPFGNIIFAICRWREARVPFLATLFCFCLSVGALAIPVIVVQSLKGVERILPDFIPTLNDDQTTQLIRNGLKNSPQFKLKRLGGPDDTIR